MRYVNSLTLKILGSVQQRKLIRDPVTTGHLCAYPLREKYARFAFDFCDVASAVKSIKTEGQILVNSEDPSFKIQVSSWHSSMLTNN
jgi:hypothetical protein